MGSWASGLIYYYFKHQKRMMRSDNIFGGLGASRTSGSSAGRWENRPTSYDRPRNDRPKLGSYRLTEQEERRNGPGDDLLRVVQQWKDDPPASLCAHLSLMHLTPLEHRIEDYALIRNKGLSFEQQRRRVEEAVRKGCFNEELLRVTQDERAFSRMSELTFSQVEEAMRDSNGAKTSRFSNAPSPVNNHYHSRDGNSARGERTTGGGYAGYSHTASNYLHKTPDKNRSQNNMFGTTAGSTNIFSQNSAGTGGGSGRVTRSSSRTQQEATSNTANIFKTGGQSTGTSGTTGGQSSGTLVFGNNAGRQSASSTPGGTTSANIFGGNGGGSAGTGAPANLFTGGTSGGGQTQQQGQNMFQQNGGGQSSQGSSHLPVYQPLFQQGSEQFMMGLSQRLIEDKKMLGLMDQLLSRESKKEENQERQDSGLWARTPYQQAGLYQAEPEQRQREIIYVVRKGQNYPKSQSSQVEQKEPNQASVNYNSYSNVDPSRCTYRQGTHLAQRTHRTMRTQRTQYYFKNLQKDERIQCDVEFSIKWTDPEGVVFKESEAKTYKANFEVPFIDLTVSAGREELIKQLKKHQPIVRSDAFFVPNEGQCQQGNGFLVLKGVIKQRLINVSREGTSVIFSQIRNGCIEGLAITKDGVGTINWDRVKYDILDFAEEGVVFTFNPNEVECTLPALDCTCRVTFDSLPPSVLNQLSKGADYMRTIEEFKDKVERSTPNFERPHVYSSGKWVLRVRRFRQEQLE